jgi:hypothetical protein
MDALGQPVLLLFADLSLEKESAGIDATGCLISALPFFGRALGLQGLACLASSSQQLKQECVKYIAENALLLLDDALPSVAAVGGTASAAEAAMATAVAEVPAGAAAAVSLPSPADQRLPPMVLWLLQNSPGTAANAQAAEVLQRLLHIPRVPLQQAQQLVAAGVRIRFEPLLAAASSMIAGVEVWVQAQHALGISTDIPAAAVAICRHRSMVSVHSVASPTVGNMEWGGCPKDYAVCHGCVHTHSCRQLNQEA